MEFTTYGKKYWYDNLKEGETLLWERFLAKFPDRYEKVAYNVKVGQGRGTPEGTDPIVSDDWYHLTRLKIDVLGVRNGEYDIIELKTEPRASVLTQLQGYKKLFLKHIDDSVKVNMILVTPEISPDLETILEGEGIDVILV